MKVLQAARQLILSRSATGARDMRSCGWVVIVLFVAGCRPPTAALSEPALPEPATFVHWPRATEKPVPVGPELWARCRALTPAEDQAREAAAKAHGPHAEYTIVVRVSPDAEAAFREGRPLPVGAMVVKEKYTDRLASGPLHGYAVMAKRAAGFFPDGGDWEYAFVALAPDRKVSRGRLAECAGCHASVRGADYLFRSYGGAKQ
jgi:hypothetical protein